MTYRDDLDTGQGAKLYKDFIRGVFFSFRDSLIFVHLSGD